MWQFRRGTVFVLSFLMAFGPNLFWGNQSAAQDGGEIYDEMGTEPAPNPLGEPSPDYDLALDENGLPQRLDYEDFEGVPADELRQDYFPMAYSEKGEKIREITRTSIDRELVKMGQHYQEELLQNWPGDQGQIPSNYDPVIHGHYQVKFVLSMSQMQQLDQLYAREKEHYDHNIDMARYTAGLVGAIPSIRRAKHKFFGPAEPFNKDIIKLEGWQKSMEGLYKDFLSEQDNARLSNLDGRIAELERQEADAKRTGESFDSGELNKAKQTRTEILKPAIEKIQRITAERSRLKNLSALEGEIVRQFPNRQNVTREAVAEFAEKHSKQLRELGIRYDRRRSGGAVSSILGQITKQKREILGNWTEREFEKIAKNYQRHMQDFTNLRNRILADMDTDILKALRSGLNGEGSFANWSAKKIHDMILEVDYKMAEGMPLTEAEKRFLDDLVEIEERRIEIEKNEEGLSERKLRNELKKKAVPENLQEKISLKDVVEKKEVPTADIITEEENGKASEKPKEGSSERAPKTKTRVVVQIPDYMEPGKVRTFEYSEFDSNPVGKSTRIAAIFRAIKQSLVERVFGSSAYMFEETPPKRVGDGIRSYPGLKNFTFENPYDLNKNPSQREYLDSIREKATKQKLTEGKGNRTGRYWVKVQEVWNATKGKYEYVMKRIFDEQKRPKITQFKNRFAKNFRDNWNKASGKTKKWFVEKHPGILNMIQIGAAVAVGDQLAKWLYDRPSFLTSALPGTLPWDEDGNISAKFIDEVKLRILKEHEEENILASREGRRSKFACEPEEFPNDLCMCKDIPCILPFYLHPGVLEEVVEIWEDHDEGEMRIAFEE